LKHVVIPSSVDWSCTVQSPRSFVPARPHWGRVWGSSWSSALLHTEIWLGSSQSVISEYCSFGRLYII